MQSQIAPCILCNCCICCLPSPPTPIYKGRRPADPKAMDPMIQPVVAPSEGYYVGPEPMWGRALCGPGPHVGPGPIWPQVPYGPEKARAPYGHGSHMGPDPNLGPGRIWTRAPYGPRSHTGPGPIQARAPYPYGPGPIWSEMAI